MVRSEAAHKPLVRARQPAVNHCSGQSVHLAVHLHVHVDGHLHGACTMDGRWITYAELGRLMGGKSPGAGRQRANRRKYRKQAGNDGRALVFVPPEDLAELEASVHMAVHADVQQNGYPAVHVNGKDIEAEWLARLERLQVEMTELARKLGAAESEAANARTAVEELRQDRDTWKAQAEAWRVQAENRVGESEGELQAVRGERDRLIGDLRTMHERMAKTEHDRDRLAHELEVHLRLPWWRRLFA